MNAGRTLITLLVASTALACRPDVELAVPCGSESDLSCPTGFHCDVTSGFCIDGEGHPRVTFTDFTPGDDLKGRVEVNLELLSVKGVESVTLEAQGGGQVTLGLTPSLIYGDEIHGTWAATFDTWTLSDGPGTLVATATDAVGQVTTQRLDMNVANGAPVISLSSPQNETVVSAPFDLDASITSFVPLKSVVARIQGHTYVLTQDVRWSTGDRLSGELAATIGGDLSSGAAVLELSATDDAGVTSVVTLNVEIYTGS